MFWKIDGSSDGAPLNGIYIDTGLPQIDYYESVAVSPDDNVFLHMKIRGGTLKEEAPQG